VISRIAQPAHIHRHGFGIAKHGQARDNENQRQYHGAEWVYVPYGIQGKATGALGRWVTKEICDISMGSLVKANCHDCADDVRND
jgi:hypothetical protein